MTPDELRSLIAEVLGIDLAQVRDDLAYGDLPQWDSLHHVELVLALEERLDVEIGPEEIVELSNVELIEEFVAGHSGATDGASSPAG